MSRSQLESALRSTRVDLDGTTRRMGELGRDLAYAHATCSVQHLWGTKQARQLYAKEQKKQPDRQRLLHEDGNGKVWTHDEVIESLEMECQRKQREEREKEDRQQQRTDVAERKRKCEEEWKAVQLAHQNAITVWEVEFKRGGSKG
jgi:hypothetical protein